MAVYDLYSDELSRGTNSSYVYDPKTGQWVPRTSSSKSGNSTSSYTTETKTPAGSNSDTSKVDSQTKAEKEYIETEFNTLEGEIALIPSVKSLKIKTGDTIKLDGVGKYLSGLYYVSAINKAIDSSGFAMSLTVIKTGFGNSLKKAAEKEEAKETRVDEVEKQEDTNFKVGDKVRFLTVAAKTYTYSNGADGVWVPKWVTEQVHTIDGISEDKTRVRLKEIWSWTYVKNLKRA